MGWTSMPLASMGDTPTPKRYLDNQLTYEREGEGDVPFHGYRVVASVYNGSYYAAVQRYDASGPGETTAVVCLVRWNPRAADGFVFAYKDMTERGGPYEANCPLSVLDRLSPTMDPNSLDWRRRCHEALRLRKRHVPDGALIRFPNAISFSDGTSHQLMRVRRENNKIVLSPKEGLGYYKVSRLLTRNFEIVREAKVMPTIFLKGS